MLMLGIQGFFVVLTISPAKHAMALTSVTCLIPDRMLAGQAVPFLISSVGLGQQAGLYHF